MQETDWERMRRRTRWLRVLVARHPWLQRLLCALLKLPCVVAAVLDPIGLLFVMAGQAHERRSSQAEPPGWPRRFR